MQRGVYALKCWTLRFPLVVRSAHRHTLVCEMPFWKLELGIVSVAIFVICRQNGHKKVELSPPKSWSRPFQAPKILQLAFMNLRKVLKLYAKNTTQTGALSITWYDILLYGLFDFKWSIVYWVNIMLCWGRQETRDGEHELCSWLDSTKKNANIWALAFIKLYKTGLGPALKHIQGTAALIWW